MSVHAVQRTLEERLGWTVHRITAVAGGDLNDAYRVVTPDGERFVKSAPGAEPGTFAAEAAGLRWLGEPAGAAPVPAVLGWHDPPAGDATATPTTPEDFAALRAAAAEARLLALEWISPGPLDAPAAAELGRGLAATHAAGAPAFGATPWPTRNGAGFELTQRPSRLGPVALPNVAAPTFAEFYGQQRLLPLTRLATEIGTFSAGEAASIEHLVDRLPELCGPPEPPARCHGDLWTGNVLAGADGHARLIDPAAHGGHREVDLAVLQLFGAPPRELFDAYDEAAPRADGHHERTELFQLGVVLLHVVLFGGPYVASALRIVHAYR